MHHCTAESLTARHWGRNKYTLNQNLSIWKWLWTFFSPLRVTEQQDVIYTLTWSAEWMLMALTLLSSVNTWDFLLACYGKIIHLTCFEMSFLGKPVFVFQTIWNALVPSFLHENVHTYLNLLITRGFSKITPKGENF